MTQEKIDLIQFYKERRLLISRLLEKVRKRGRSKTRGDKKYSEFQISHFYRFTRQVNHIQDKRDKIFKSCDHKFPDKTSALEYDDVFDENICQICSAVIV